MHLSTRLGSYTPEPSLPRRQNAEPPSSTRSMNLTDAEAGALLTWTFQIVNSIIGATVAGCLLLSIARLRTRSARDVLIASMVMACLIMAVDCGIQCIFTAVNQHTWACPIESFVHLLTILVQVMTMAVLGVVNARELRHRKTSRGHACMLNLLIWIVALVGTLVGGVLSVTRVFSWSDSEVFCFYDFSSPVIGFWFVPCFGLSVCVLVFSLIDMFRVAMQTHRLVVPVQRKSSSRLGQSIVCRSFGLVCILLFGWGMILISSCYQLVFSSRLPAGMAMTVMILDSVNLVLVPLVYGCLRPAHRHALCGLFRQLDSLHNHVPSPTLPMPNQISPSSPRAPSTGRTFLTARLELAQQHDLRSPNPTPRTRDHLSLVPGVVMTSD